ncbi:hypothetical protein Btru_075243 [Bulinus truncatus]|nr:hypothetical protein Btru_075243 [Bulinus truncatus]
MHGKYRLLFSLLPIFLESECKVCTKREEIGDREGNHYNCDDTALPDCCERNNTFTCCQSQWKQSALEVLWLLAAVAAILILMCVLLRYLTGQSEIFTSPTIQDAARNWKRKITHLFDCFHGPNGKEKHGQSSGSFSNLSCDKRTLMSAKSGLMNRLYLTTEA